ncbi:MAG: RusA family crossover junction endodeoxyribonuclease [Pirellulales bacterium]|nr:RusA family crossover junction endodeoxyribonuclease [Pirellulales bacterium]
MSVITMSVEQVRQLTKRRKSSKRAEERAAIETRRLTYRVSTEPVQFRLPFPPSLNRYYRTAVIAGHAQTYISKEGKAYREYVIKEWRRIGITFKGRLAIKVAAVFPDHRPYDLDGLWKALLDALEHAGAYEKDEQIKAESIEQDRIEAPGWVDIILGPKPGDRQGTLFETEW